MTEKTLQKRDSMTAVARKIDELATVAGSVFDNTNGSFEEALTVAQAMNDLRLALTDDMMAPIMSLMNTDLGFRTDHDPNQTDQKTGKPYVPYPVSVVRECFIESKLRGYNAIGNEWNIIAARFYACKNGLFRRVTQFPGVTEFKADIGVPRTVGDKGALVNVKATWSRNGVPGNIEAEIPVRVNSFMGADAIVGKAQRKLLARVLERLSGRQTPEAEVGEDAPALPAPHESVPQPNFGPAPKPASAQTATEPPAVRKRAKTAPTELLPAAAPAVQVVTGTQGYVEPVSEPAAEEPDSGGPPALTVQQELLETTLAALFESIPGSNFADFQEWAVAYWPKSNYGNISGVIDLTDQQCDDVLTRRKSLTGWVRTNAERRHAVPAKAS